MKCSSALLLAWILLMATAAPIDLRAAENPATEKEKIEALIKQLETLKDATFIRNGSSYDAKTAAKFLRGKWHAHDKEIKTATDFIDKVASVSGTTDKPYVIRFKDAGEVKCGEYLKEQLKKLEKEKPERNEAPGLSNRQSEAKSSVDTNSIVAPLYIRRYRIDFSKLPHAENWPAEDYTRRAGDSLKRYLEENGLDLSPPQSMFIKPSEGNFMVRTTLEQIEKIEQLIIPLR